ncbi:hypothetical protein Dimus_035667 [Dionaea muscipula]
MNVPEPKPLATMAEIEKVFNKFDANGDGKISFQELGSLLTALGAGTSKEEVIAMMKEMDANGDGSVDLKEFSNFNIQSSPTAPAPAADGSGAAEINQDLQQAFAVFDKDKNGLISASELHDVLKKLGEKCSVKDCSRMISSIDVDGDGHVNFDEFQKLMAV